MQRPVAERTRSAEVESKVPLAVFVSDKHVPNKSEYKFSNFEDWLRGPRPAPTRLEPIFTSKSMESARMIQTAP